MRLRHCLSIAKRRSSTYTSYSPFSIRRMLASIQYLSCNLSLEPSAAPFSVCVCVHWFLQIWFWFAFPAPRHQGLIAACSLLSLANTTRRRYIVQKQVTQPVLPSSLGSYGISLTPPVREIDLWIDKDFGETLIDRYQVYLPDTWTTTQKVYLLRETLSSPAEYTYT